MGPRVFDKKTIVSALKELIPPQTIIAAILKGFVKLAQTEPILEVVRIAPVVHLEFAHGGDCCIKSGFVEGGDYFCVKIASGGFPGLDGSGGAAGGTMVVFSQVTGELEAVLLDEGWLTDLRTAAAGALFARYLAPRSVRAIGIVGTGIQARFQLEMLKTETGCRRVIVWGRNASKVDLLLHDMAESEYRIERADNLEDLCRVCNLIVTVTSSKSPLIRAEWIQPGTHVSAIGADGLGKQELAEEIFSRADLCVADSRRQCCDFGETSHGIRAGVLREEDVIEIGELSSRPDLHRTDDRDSRITVADSTGVAIQDVMIAELAYTACTNSARL